MCGLAGYNISRDLAGRFLTEDKQKEVLRQAWLHNLHRGWDAAGYFAASADGKTKVFKAPGAVPDILMDTIDKPDHKLPVSTVLGAHTRAYTTGTPKDNRNNHPVTWGGVYVTHNGVIKNDIKIRNQYTTKKQRKNFPDVDSAVIPLILDAKMNNAFDIDGLYEACKELTGAYSFHAVFLDNPGVSIIVKGTDRPLDIAYIKEEGFFYGSEKEVIWEMINAMGINPNKGWKWGKLDDNKFIILDDGKIVKHGSLHIPTTTTDANQETKRFLPKEGERERLVIHKTRSKFDYLNKHDLHTCVGNEDKMEVVYRRSECLDSEDKRFQFPQANDSVFGAVAAEADVIYEYGPFLHAMFGNVEVITQHGKTLVDIVNHDLFKHASKSRWVTEEDKLKLGNKVPGSQLSLDDFLRLHTTGIGKIPEDSSLPEYIIKEQKSKKGIATQSESGGWVLLKNNSSQASTCEVDEEDLDENPELETIWPDLEVTWDNLFMDPIVWHETENMFFLQDRRCPLHNEQMGTHSEPFECVTAVAAAAYALAAIGDLECMSMFDGTYVQYATDPNACTNENNKDCEWIRDEVLRVQFQYTQWYITIAQMCRHCNSWRGVNKLPEWLYTLDTEGPIEVKAVLAS